MTDQPTGSTVPRRQLGRYLRDLRNQARLTVRAAATKLEWSEAKMWRIETGQTSLRSLDVEAMCKLYGAGPHLTKALMALAKETKVRDWWRPFSDTPPNGYDLYISLEDAAASMLWYQSELVPGLFQTEDYARVIIAAHNPDCDEAEVEHRVHVRMARQTLLTRATDPPKIDVVVNESVVRRPVGGVDIMTAQLERLLEVAALPHVALRVIPFAAGFHQGLNTGSFMILRFPVDGGGRHIEPPTVYVENFVGQLFLDKKRYSDGFATAFEQLSDMALDRPGSVQLIKEAIGEIQK